MKRTEATIHDIARALNISASTVSRALKDNPLISAATREKIRKTAEEMGYRPNVVASSLRTKRSNMIGIIVPYINRHFFSSVVSGVEEVAYKAGFAVTISQSNDSYQKEVQLARALYDSRVDGVIVSFAMDTHNFRHLSMFAESRIPLVFFDRITDEIDANRIVVDDFSGGRTATEHLIAQGCRNIAHVSGPLHLQIYDNRLKGYLAALSEAGLQPPPGGILHNRLTRADGEEAIRQLLTLKPLPDAIFCANDTTALSIILSLRNSPYKVPDDIAVVGFSNEPFSGLITPTITTISQPGYEMGCRSAELLIAEIKGEINAMQYQTYTMPTELIIRESSVRVP
ncbi:MAG: LacI family DNA-binding transcriptional regulator [Bacteroidota bacterium]